jgi:uncharacterized protein (DUF1330 family)
MAKGYLVAQIRVHDKDGYEKFKAMSGPAITEFGGRVLARDPNPEVREGQKHGISILIEFESIDAARRFYDSAPYTAARKVRELAADTDLLLAEGV